MITKDFDKSVLIDSLINQLNVDITAYQDAIINTYGKDPLTQETINYYQSQIAEAQNGISALQQEKIKLGG